MVFARYEIGSYLHCASVAVGGGAKRALLEVAHGACDVCRALASGEADLARTLMLTKLRADEAPACDLGQP